MGITVVKRNGSAEPYDANKINLAIEHASAGLDPNITWVTQIASRAGAHALRRHHHPAARRGRHPGRAAERQGRPGVRHRRGPPAAQDHLQARARRLRRRTTSSRRCTAQHFRGYIERGVAEDAARPALHRAVRPRPPRRLRSTPRATSCSSTSASSPSTTATASRRATASRSRCRSTSGCASRWACRSTRRTPPAAALGFYDKMSQPRLPRRRLHAGQRRHRSTRSSPTASSWRCRTTSSTSPRPSATSCG